MQYLTLTPARGAVSSPLWNPLCQHVCQSGCPTVLVVIDDLTYQRGICGLAAKRVIKCREFFLRKCHFYKNWIFGKVHHTILKKNYVPNSCKLLVIVSIEVFLEVQFLYWKSKYNTVKAEPRGALPSNFEGQGWHCSVSTRKTSGIHIVSN